jgi:CHAT domain-containing protein
VKRHGVEATCIALFASAVFPTSAWAHLPDALCADSAAKIAAYPADADLERAANALEAHLASSVGRKVDLESALQQLEVPTRAVQPPSKFAQAKYCAAAGELMRVAPQGSPFQAQSYLIHAFQIAQASGASDVAAASAYRLGLVSLRTPTVAGTRSGGRARKTSVVAAQVSAAAQTSDGSVCDALRDPNVLDNTGAYIAAMSLRCSALIAQNGGRNEQLAIADLRLARLALSVLRSNAKLAPDARADALSTALEGLLAAAQIEDPRRRGEVLGRLLWTAEDIGVVRGSLANSVAALRAAVPGDPANEAVASAIEGRQALDASNRQRARALFAKAILAEAQRPIPARLPQYYLLLAEADPADRAAHVAAAYQALQNVRQLLPRIDTLTDETTFALYTQDVFQQVVGVQLASTGAAGESVRIQQAQQVVEAYRQAELESVYGDECEPSKEAVRPAQLKPGEFILYPILLPDRLELLYAKAGDAGYQRVPANRSVDRRKLAQLAEQMTLSLANGQEDWQAASSELYRLLIKPIESQLGSNATLAIIPDGPLRAVPFAALTDEQGHFLVQRAKVAVAPALAYSQPGTTLDSQHAAIVAASLQREIDLPYGYFPKLEGTSAEAQIAAAAGDAHHSRFIPDFTKADLVTALNGNNVDVLHLATHAAFNGDSERAFIVANGDFITLPELRSIVERNAKRGDQLALLVLSACETAVGDDEATMGLAGAAVEAGAQSAIASLWQVNDVGTSALMKNFYQNFRGGESRAEALRRAQLAMIAGGGAGADPNIWAAFTLLGAWR